MCPLSETDELEDKLIRPEAYDAVILRGCVLIDGTGSTALEDATVVLVGDRISAVGRSREVRVPSGPRVRTIDARGNYVMPGLIDCHVHLNGERHTSGYERYIEEYPDVRVLRAAASAKALLAAGFTTVRHLGHGYPAHIEAVKTAVRSGQLPGPRILTSGWAISQTGGHGKLSGWPYSLVEALRPRSAFADGAAECRRLVRHNIAAGADCIKVFTSEGRIDAPETGISNFSVPEVMAIVNQAHRQGRRVAAHSTSVEGTWRAVRGGVDTVEHGPDVPDESLLKALATLRISLVPTLTVFEWASRAGESPHAEWVRNRAAQQFAARKSVVQAARAMGVQIAVGSDSGAPPKLGRAAEELECLVQAGMTPEEAIASACVHAASALGVEGEIGSVSAGKRADLLVLRADPVTDITRLQRRENIAYIVQPQGVVV